ncbi:hypothetical protein AB0H83_44045 [Dactylosporangium sp. NPDC050688]|uniref:hypothetical protein n=1 Tax=Dactylosporangium sp. NPDC050688 TaxID=3157217 RepID=UPI0033EE5B36
MEPGRYILTCGNHTLDFGCATIRTPRLALANRPDLRAAVAGVDAAAWYVCTDGEGIHLYLQVNDTTSTNLRRPARSWPRRSDLTQSRRAGR